MHKTSQPRSDVVLLSMKQCQMFWEGIKKTCHIIARSALYVRTDKTRMSQICSAALQIIITFYRAASEGGDSAVVYR